MYCKAGKTIQCKKTKYISWSLWAPQSSVKEHQTAVHCVVNFCTCMQELHRIKGGIKLLVKVTGDVSGRGQRSRLTNSRRLRTLGYSSKKNEGWVERHDTNFHSEKQWEISKERSCTHSQSLRIFQPNSASEREEWQRRGTICNIFEVRTKAFLKSISCFWEIVCFPLTWSHHTIISFTVYIPKSSPSRHALSIL